MSKGSVPISTEKNTKWALSTFREWISSRNTCCTGEETIDIDILSKPVNKSCTELCRVLCLFAVEARKVNGDPYPAKTVVFNLLAGLLCYANSVEPIFWIPKMHSLESCKAQWIPISKSYKKRTLEQRSNIVVWLLLMRKRFALGASVEHLARLHHLLYFKACFITMARCFVLEVEMNTGNSSSHN